MSEETTAGLQIVGPPRVALNQSAASIHDDDAAKRLGFRGSAVAGSVHLDVFAPLLVEAYGEEWFERGALSVYFHNVVVSGEQVQAVVDRPHPSGAQTSIIARRADDHEIVVCAGTASLGDHARSELATRDLRLCDSSALRMMQGVEPGALLGSERFVASRSAQLAQMESGGLNEPMDWYRDESPWGGTIASPSTTASLMFRLLTGDDEVQRHDRISPHIGAAFGMFGAFQIEYVNGPVLLDRPYTVTGRVIGVGESPKTEYLWWDAEAVDDDGRVAARMRHLLRFLKASSPLYD
jgi:acyl dehydratase